MPLKITKRPFYFTLEASFVFKIFIFFVSTFLSYRETSNSKFMTSQTGKQVKYTYCPISQEVKVIRQRKLVSLWNITWEISFLKNHTQNMLKKLVSDLFLKKIKIEHIPVGLSKYIETKVLTMCFYVMQRFF